MRTTEEFLNDINNEQAKYEQIAQLDNTSGASVWGTMKKLFAYMASQVSSLIDDHKAEVNGLILAQKVGSENWYINQLKSFQYGDNIIVENDRIKYDVVDASKQVAKEASLVVQSDNTLFFKTVGQLADLKRRRLEDEELAALKYYMEKVKFLGTKIEIQSNNPDLVYVKCKVKLNRLLLRIDGSLLNDSGTFPVYNSMKEWLENRPFDSVCNIALLEAFLMGLPWVQEVSDIQISYMDYTGAITQKDYYKPASGWLQFDPQSTIEYVF